MKIIFYKKSDLSLISMRMSMNTGANIETSQHFFEIFISDNNFDVNEYGFCEVNNIPEGWDEGKYVFDIATQSIIANVNYKPPTISTKTIPSTNTETGQSTT